MKREEIKEILKDLNPTDDVINKIMTINGNGINTLKEQYNGDITALKTQLSDRDKDIEKLKSTPNNTEELTKQLEQLQEKYNNDTKNLQSQIDSRNYLDAVKSAVAEKGIKFTSKAAERYYFSQAESEKLKLENGKLLGFDDFHKKQLEADKDAFVAADKPTDTPSPTPDTMHFAGSAGNGGNPAVSAAVLAAQRFSKTYNPIAETNTTNPKGE